MTKAKRNSKLRRLFGITRAWALVSCVFVLFQNCSNGFEPISSSGKDDLNSISPYTIKNVQSTPATANGTDALNIRIEILTNGQPAIGAVPNISITGTFSLRSACTPCNSFGVSNCSITSTVAGTRTLNITSPANYQTEIIFNPGPASTITVLAGQNQTANAGSAVLIQPRVRVTDAYNNVISQASLQFIPSTGGAVQFANVLTDANGEASPGQWTLSSIAGTNTLRVQAETATVNIGANGVNATTNPLRVVYFPAGTCSTNKIEIYVNGSPHPQYQFIDSGDCIKMDDIIARGTLRIRCVDPTGVMAESDFIGPGVNAGTSDTTRCVKILGG